MSDKTKAKASCPLAVMDQAAAALKYAGAKREGIDSIIEARATMAELVAADREYEEARRDWDRATGSDPKSLQDEEWLRIADRFEAACMRRLKAMDKFGEVK